MTALVHYLFLRLSYQNIFLNLGHNVQKPLKKINVTIFQKFKCFFKVACYQCKFFITFSLPAYEYEMTNNVIIQKLC